MNFRTTYVLFGVLGAMVVVFGLALWLAPTTQVDEKYLFPSAGPETSRLGTGDVVRVEIDRAAEGVHLVFERDKDGSEYRLVKPEGYRIRTSEVNTVISQLLNAQGLQADLSDDLDEWGLEKPKGSVKLTTTEGRDLVLYLGDSSGDRHYVTTSDNPKKPRAVAKQTIAAAFNPLYEFRSRELIPVDSGDIKVIRIAQPSNREQVILAANGAEWHYEEPKYGLAELEGSFEAGAKGLQGVRSLLDALSNLRAEGKIPEPAKTADGEKEPKKEDIAVDRKKQLGFYSDNADDAQLAEWGLKSEEDASLVLTVKEDPAKDGSTVVIGKEIPKADLFYARLLGEKKVYTVTKASLATFRDLLTNKEALRDRKLVSLPEKPDVVRVTYPGGEEILLHRSSVEAPPNPHGFGPRDEGSWALYRGKETKGMQTDAAAINALVSMLTAGRKVEEFPANADDPALGLKDPNNLTVSLWVNGIKKDEPTKEEVKKEPKEGDKKEEEKKEGDRPELARATPDVQLVFGRVDSKNLAAIERRTGPELKQIDVVKVKDEVLKTARADMLTYLDKGLESIIPAGNPAKLAVEFDGKTTVAEKPKPDESASQWVLKQPAELDGRKADQGRVMGIISELRHMEAVHWESLKATEEQLGKWGLRNPAGKITVTTIEDMKTKEGSLLIGSATDDKAGFYAKRGDGDAVFVLSKTEVESFKGPLADMQIVNVAPQDVRSLKFTGWPTLGKPTVVELTREDSSTWKGKDLVAGVTVNSFQVEKILEQLAQLRAKKFVVYKSGPKDEHGVDPKKGGLEIELGLDKEKVTVTLGSASGDDLFATSSKLPGDVFTIGKGADDILEKVKKDASLLAK